MLMNPQYPPAACYADMYRGGGHSTHSPYLQSAATPASQLQHSFQHHNNNINTAAASAATHEFYGSNPMSLGCYEPSPSRHSHVSGVDAGDLAAAAARSLVPPSYGYPCAMPGMEQPLHMYPSPHSMWQNSQLLVDDKRGPVIMGQSPPQPPVKRKGGRKPKDDPNLPPIEKEKRRLRRLRNKEAAAKCRERRLNHTSGLLQQIEQLEKSQKSFEDKIANLRHNKEQCEKLLTSHSKGCSKLFSGASGSSLPPPAASSSSTVQSSLTSSPASIQTPSPPAPIPSAAAVISQTLGAGNRRKQTTPRLNVDISCSDSHRRTSSSSSGELQSPPVIH